MQVVECLVDIALAVYDGLGRHGFLGLQLAQATLAAQDALGIGDLRADGDLAVGPRDDAITRNKTRTSRIGRGCLDGVDGRVEHVHIAQEQLGHAYVLGSIRELVEKARPDFGTTVLDACTGHVDERKFTTGKLGLQKLIDELGRGMRVPGHEGEHIRPEQMLDQALKCRRRGKKLADG